MKTAKEIISHIEAELEDIYKQYHHWKDIDTSEAAKYLIKANTLESVLEQIDPLEEEDEQIAQVLVSDPREEKPKNTLLDIYLDIFSAVVFLSSSVAVWIIVSHIAKLLGLFDFFQEVFCYTFLCIHIFSFGQLMKGRA